MDHDERLDRVDACPPEARAEAGVLLNVDESKGTTLRLAKDGHVRSCRFWHYGFVLTFHE